MNDQDFINYVGPIGLEPILFCTKNKRVTNYTIGQNLKRECKFNTKFYLYKHFSKIISNTLRFLKNTGDITGSLLLFLHDTIRYNFSLC